MSCEIHKICGTGKMTFANFKFYAGLLVCISLEFSQPTLEDFDQVMTGIKQLLDNKQGFSMFVDASKVTKVPASAAWRIIQFMRANRPEFAKYTRSSAIVVGNPFVANLLNWVFTMQPPASPNKVVTDSAEGLQFVEKYMEATSLGSPPDITVSA